MHFKSIIPYHWKVKARFWLMNFRRNPYFTESQLKDKKRIYIFLAADYSNLGDVAITYAQHVFLQYHFPDRQIFEIPISQTIEGLHFIKQHLQPQDVITTVGGGNFGNLYQDIEFLREWVVGSFLQNKTILFPLTNDFSEDNAGQVALAKAKNVYSRHPNLTIVAREEITQRRNLLAFSTNNCILTPDIVMSLDKTQPTIERQGVVLALRSDKEKNLTSDQSTDLQMLIQKNFLNVKAYDTHLGRGNLSYTERNMELESIWTAFRSAELVVTDRLHGMIFCYITNTPCVVLMNNNHKIRSSYEWIKHSKGILLLTEFSKTNIQEVFDMVKNKLVKAEYKNLEDQFNPILDAINH